MDGLEVTRLHNITLHKCECCGRVRDIPFRLFISNAESKLIAGEIDFCDDCGKNFCQLLGLPVPDPIVLKEFRFDGN